MQTLDIYPTLAALCRHCNADDLDGFPLSQLLNDPNLPWDRPAYTRAGTADRYAAAVRTERWRYAEYGSNGAEGTMLIDMQNDPHELKNLADDPQHAAVRAEMKALLAREPRPAK